MSEAAAPDSRRHDLKVALVAFKYAYGVPARGISYEYQNFYLCLKEIFREVVFFDFMERVAAEGRVGMNAALSAFIEAERPDVAIFTPFQEEFIPEVVEGLSAHTKTVCYFFDDTWRIDYANAWAPRFDFFVTATTRAMRRYRMLGAGYENAILSPYGYNHFAYRKLELPKQYDVSFVGGSHPYRSWLVERLRKAGIEVAAWGGGNWPAGMLDYDRMIEVFNQSRINLNMSNSVSWELPVLLSNWRAVQLALKSQKTKETIKGRMFELCGSGGFQLTNYAEDLEHCFDIGTEVAVYTDVDDLIEKIRYYLRFEDEREAIAAAGHRRALAEHTYAKRLAEIVEHALGA